MLILVLFLVLYRSSSAYDLIPSQKQSEAELKLLREQQFKRQIEEGFDAFLDPTHNYADFTGRVSDRNDQSQILKVSSENRNIRFFRAGDLVEFRLASQEKSRLCEGYVRSIEEGFFVMFVKDLNRCFSSDAFFRRGTMLVFRSERLAERVLEASKYRVVLVKRRRDFFEQLNRINHFVWSFDQERVKVAADYDRRILALQEEREQALTGLIKTKQDNLRLQTELKSQLDHLDRDLDFYRISKDQLLVDRWHLDHDVGLPVGERPQKEVKTESTIQELYDRRDFQ